MSTFRAGGEPLRSGSRSAWERGSYKPVVSILIGEIGIDLTGEKGNSRRSELLDALAGQPLAHVDAVLERLALDNTGSETTSKGVTRNTLIQIPCGW